MAKGSFKVVQWLYTLNAPADGSTTDLATLSPMSATSERFTYTVPAGMWLGITDATIQSKMFGSRSSYLMLPGVFNLPSHVGAFSFRVPIVLAPGTAVHGRLINFSGEQHWINASVQGLLVPKSSDDYRDSFGSLFG